MSALQHRLLALWALLLVSVVCLVFLPLSRLASLGVMVLCWLLIALCWRVARRRRASEVAVSLDALPEAGYRQPVVLVCGDLAQPWPATSPVLVVSQGCWVRVEAGQDVAQVARQLLQLRPDWGRQLAVMVTVCPQQHPESDTLTSDLLVWRWQISQLQRDTGHRVPLVLHGQVGSALLSDRVWQSAILGEPVTVWRESDAPCSVATWVTAEGTSALEQQVLFNSLMGWFEPHVQAVFRAPNPDIPAIVPSAVVWGMGPGLSAVLPDSLWTHWLSRHTALRQSAGWLPGQTVITDNALLPDFVLPLLPEGRGLTPRQRTGRGAIALFTLAAIAALCSSGWNNRHLLQRLSFDIAHYDRISMDNYVPKAEAVKVLREDAQQLDQWARNGAPLGINLGLYQGERVHLPVLAAIRSYIPPPPPPPKPKPEAEPKIIRLDSLSLFDSGKAVLKPDSTKMLVNSLVGIKAKPGWLIVVSGHTDNTGNAKQNQILSLQRAEAVRNWMRDTGDVPESCFAVQGYGDSRPMAPNDTDAGRAQNRRVEISLVPQADACQVPDNNPPSSQDGDGTQH
ncbi:hypothetical protein C9426_35330 [Serratia sp. S1B]|nr:hypothetical protein C9426_35330 [Serratia sp. S1B]